MALGIVAQATHVFSDVPDTHIFANDIHWSEANGIVFGYGDGRFGPEDFMTRGQLVAIIHRYHEKFPVGSGSTGATGAAGAAGTPGADGADGVSGYQVFTSVQDFGPGGIGGSWCGAPAANETDQGWVVLGGGAQLLPADIDAGFAIAGSWPNSTDPLNPGWNIQLNKPPDVDPGNVTTYVICAKIPTD